MSDSEEGLVIEVRRLERELRESKMTLRDEFAARAMQGWLHTFKDGPHPSHTANGTAYLARQSYAIAEAMMVERDLRYALKEGRK
jgi:hypothetical protein